MAGRRALGPIAEEEAMALETEPEDRAVVELEEVYKNAEAMAAALESRARCIRETIRDMRANQDRTPYSKAWTVTRDVLNLHSMGREAGAVRALATVAHFTPREVPA